MFANYVKSPPVSLYTAGTSTDRMPDNYGGRISNSYVYTYVCVCVCVCVCVSVCVCVCAFVAVYHERVSGRERTARREELKRRETRRAGRIR